MEPKADASKPSTLTPGSEAQQDEEAAERAKREIEEDKLIALEDQKVVAQQEAQQRAQQEVQQMAQHQNKGKQATKA